MKQEPKSDPIKTVWVTKYALTKGIYQQRVEHPEGSSYCYTLRGASLCRQQFVVDRDCYDDFGVAKSAAKAMAFRKIESLKKQLAKAEKLYQEPKVVK